MSQDTFIYKFGLDSLLLSEFSSRSEVIVNLIIIQLDVFAFAGATCNTLLQRGIVGRDAAQRAATRRARTIYC